VFGRKKMRAGPAVQTAVSIRFCPVIVHDAEYSAERVRAQALYTYGGIPEENRLPKYSHCDTMFRKAKLMEIRYIAGPEDIKTYQTDRLRSDFLIGGLFRPGMAKLVYCHADRMIVGGIFPTGPIALPAGSELKADYFLERREMGVINIGGRGSVSVDGTTLELDARDGLYLGRGAREVSFMSANPAKPAKFYCLSAPAHHAYPTQMIARGSVKPLAFGTPAESNVRTISKYIQPGGVASCQLVMGLTTLQADSVWNSMPCHTHERRMEVYLYFDFDEKAAVFHFMGRPNQTRHIVIRNEEAVISPSWSIHTGVGTSAYSFIWGMAGENQEFTDMDGVSMKELA
jgi:4-deoxy-L-threo-5-hexosulose-uronate ketol-isomerase